MARMATNAVSAIGNSGRFSIHSTTRSPAEIPAARRLRAQDAAMRPNAPQVMDCQAPFRNARSIGLSGHFRDRANIIEARFGHVG
jgi:hypothetical protein